MTQTRIAASTKASKSCTSGIEFGIADDAEDMAIRGLELILKPCHPKRFDWL
jgi:hypothetical protein